MFTDSSVELRVSCSHLTRNTRVTHSRKVPTKSRGAEGNSGLRSQRRANSECTSLSCSEPLGEGGLFFSFPCKSVAVVSNSAAGQTEEATPGQIRHMLVAEVSSFGLDPAFASPAS